MLATTSDILAMCVQGYGTRQRMLTVVTTVKSLYALVAPQSPRRESLLETETPEIISVKCKLPDM